MKLVLKLGGSVLVDEEAYQEQAEKIRRLSREVEKLYVVASAQKGETDRLITASGHGEELRQALRGEATCLCYNGIANFLLQGEVRSVQKLQQYLTKMGMDPAVLTQGTGFYPIVANHCSVYGTLDLPQSLQRRQILESIDNRIVLVAGFGAESPTRDKVLLGRNSSDLVAALIAFIDGNIDELVYFKDVEGVYRGYGTHETTLVERMTLAEARAFGLGRLLDQRSLDYAKCDIRIQHHRAELGNGTLITK